MSTLADRHVVVVGSGVGGSAAALLLASSGARVTFLERTRVPQMGGAGLILQPNGLGVLYGLGLASSLQRYGHQVSFVRITDAVGQPILGHQFPDFGGGLDHALVIRRSQLMTVLIDAVQSHPDITSYFGADVFGVATGGIVSFQLDGQTHALEADLVIGADGVHSVVREHGNFGARVRRTGISYVRGIIREVAREDRFVESWTSLGVFGWAPVNVGTYFFCSATAVPLARALAHRDLAGFRSAWEQAYPPSSLMLAHVRRFEDLLLNEVYRVDCDRLVDGRLVLLGDAAHAMAPNLGQGANSALVDAAVLAFELTQAKDLDIVLRRYDQRRRAAVQVVQNVASRLGMLAELRSPGARWIRDHALRVLGHLVPDEWVLRSAFQEDPVSLLTTTRQVAARARPARV